MLRAQSPHSPIYHCPASSLPLSSPVTLRNNSVNSQQTTPPRPPRLPARTDAGTEDAKTVLRKTENLKANPGLGKVRPGGRMRPVQLFNLTRQIFANYIIYWYLSAIPTFAH